ncbi:hypothetical protein T440DRAFT_420074, partial [Plenodomus tracheiphilus IPT5]
MRATSTTDNMADGKSTPARDLMDHMRRLSVTSDTSSFSVVSVASDSPSLQSLDSSGSIAGGVQVAQNSELNSTVIEEEKKDDDNDDEKEASGSAPVPPAPPTKVVVQAATGDKAKAEPRPTATTCPFWYQFDGFKPSPTAKFREEFARLAQLQKWNKGQQQKFRLQALRAEIAFHNGTCVQKLAKWQKLCEEMGVEKDLPSITQCKAALKKVFVNLWNVIDHRRNPDIPLKHFKSRAQLSKGIRSGNFFPRDIAKHDGFINVLLKVV